MITKILVPVDFSPQSKAAIEEAVKFGRAFDALVEVVHCWRRASGEAPGADTTLSEFGTTEDGKQMREYMEELEAQGVRVHGRLQLAHDEPARAIVELAETEGHDLIVMGTHGRTGVRHWLYGSVAEKVVRGAPCPVLTVRVADAGRVWLGAETPLPPPIL
jgi:nucleotide-binding universal stress UspA family protein